MMVFSLQVQESVSDWFLRKLYGKKLAARTLSGLFARGGDDKLTHVQDFEKNGFG